MPSNYPNDEKEPWDWPTRRIRRRMRKPTLRGVLAQAKRAGLDVAAVQVNADGSIVITPGTPTDTSHKFVERPALDGNEWN